MINNLFIAVTAIATSVMAYFTYLNYKMYIQIQNKNEEHKKQTRDLYQAIVISTLLSGSAALGTGRTATQAFGDLKGLFETEYAGGTKIFK